MIMENPESILEELEKFEKKTGDGASKTLEDYIHHIAKTGDTIFPWHRIRHFMQHMLETVMNEFYETCGSGEDMSENSNVPAFSFFTTRDKLLHHFDTFTGAPFTIQRLCEIMVDPTRHYRRTDKFLRGLEKNVLVVSSIEPGSRQRRTEDPQHTLVNGLQEGGLHTTTSPLTASPIPSLPHHPKRLSLTQPTNSVLNNANDSYNAEMNDSENQVTVSEANGPSGLHREEHAMDDSLSDTSEPPSKKIRLEEEEEEEEEEEPFEERAVEPPSEELSEVKGVACSGHKEAEAEAMEVDDRVTQKAEGEAKMESEEAETANTSGQEEESSLAAPQEGDEESQEASSNPATVTDTPEGARGPENHLKEEVREEEAREEVLPSEASPEVGSSNSHSATSPSKCEEAERVLVVFSSSSSSSSSSSRTCEEGSPDSREGPEEGGGGQDVPDVAKERETTSEAAAAADDENRSESPSTPEASQQADESSRNSHEADSTSQAHSSSALNQTADTVACTEAEVDSAVPSPPPTAEVDHSSTTAAAVERPTPSNSSSVYPTSDIAAMAAAHTTSENPTPSTSTTTAPTSIVTTTTTTTTTINHSSNGVSASPDSETPDAAPAPTPDTESATSAASSTTSLPQSAACEGGKQEGVAAQSCDKQTLASISCSSSRQSEPDHQPTEEE